MRLRQFGQLCLVNGLREPFRQNRSEMGLHIAEGQAHALALQKRDRGASIEEFGVGVNLH